MTTATYYCESGDCWSDKENNFSSTDTFLHVIDSGGGVTNGNVRTWLPFVIPLRRVRVNSATLTIHSIMYQTGTGTIRISCEAADNPSTPTSGSDLNARTLTTSYNDHLIGEWNNGVDYSFDCTNAVQEIFNRSGWMPNNTMAIVITDVDFGDNQRRIYSYEGSSSLRARLTIDFQDFIPRAGGFF